MKLLDYHPLIANLPVREQSFTTNRTTWKKAEKENSDLKELNEQIFEQNQPFLTLKRQDVFDAENLKEKIIKTIYWGYPRGKSGPSCS